MRSGENFKLLFDCARLIPGAAVGASRVAVDSGWVPYQVQIGQTGLKVYPRVYVTCGTRGLSSTLLAGRVRALSSQ